jgi:hypothetical protein
MVFFPQPVPKETLLPGFSKNTLRPVIFIVEVSWVV